MSEEEYSYQEDEALNQLSQQELEAFVRVAQAYIEHSNNPEVELAFNYNLTTLIDYLPKIKYGYYDGFPELLGRTLGILKEIQSQTKDDNIKALIEEAITQVKSFYSRFHLKYEQYVYPYYGYKHSYPYSKQDKIRRAKEIYKEELGKLVDMAKQQEDESLRTMIKDNILGDLVIQSSSYGDKLPTIVDEYQKRLDWNDLDARLLKIVNEIKSEKQELEKAKAELKQLQEREQELSADETKVEELRKRLIDRAVDYIIYSGSQQ
jgi:hypothetical protein